MPWSLLVKDMPKEKHQDLDFIVDQLDWEKNVDPHFKEHNYLEPIVDKARSGKGYTDRWIVYGTVDGEQLFSAKELTVEPGAKCTLKDPGASGWITVQGRGRIGKLESANAGDDPLRRRRPRTKSSSPTKPPPRGVEDRKHRQRAARRPALLRPRRAQEAAEGGGLSEVAFRVCAFAPEALDRLGVTGALLSFPGCLPGNARSRNDCTGPFRRIEVFRNPVRADKRL